MGLVGASGEDVSRKFPKPTGVKPVGSQIVFEVLSEKELTNSKLYMPESKNMQATPQAIILELGPKVDPTWGFKVGDRVMLAGNMVPMPILSKNGRGIGVAESYIVKAVLKDEANG